MNRMILAIIRRRSLLEKRREKVFEDIRLYWNATHRINANNRFYIRPMY